MTLLPEGLISISEAASVVNQYRNVGLADSPAVQRIRKMELEVEDREELLQARRELSDWIATGKLKLYAIGGRSNERIPLTLLEINAVPFLRSLQIADLTTLRPSHPLYRQFVARFGNDLSLVSLGVSEEGARRLARTFTLRSRRRPTAERSAGRPSKSKTIEEAVEAIVLAGEWSAEKPQKDLARRVNRKLGSSFSQTTVTRALDSIALRSLDRRFHRVRRAV